MTRPDARLLVPVSFLPFVPEGSRRWISPGIYTVQTNTVEADNPPTEGHFLDLSAPALRDGAAERFDLLPWALDLIGWGTVIRLDHEDRAIVNDISGFRLRFGDAWPDLSGLDLGESIRAVAAAALRHGVRV